MEWNNAYISMKGHGVIPQIDIHTHLPLCPFQPTETLDLKNVPYLPPHPMTLITPRRLMLQESDTENQLISIYLTTLHRLMQPLCGVHIELDGKTMMDTAANSNLEPVEHGRGHSEKGSASSTTKLRKKSMTSAYLKYFETAPDGKSRICKFCKQSYSIATATGNLGRHLSHRHPGYDKQGDTGMQDLQVTPVTKKPSAHVKPSPVDLDHVNSLILRFIVEASLPPLSLEEEVFNSFRFLNSSVQLWSREKFHEVMLEVFRSMQEDVRRSLDFVNSKISLTLEFWASCEQISYMCVKGHWIDENWSCQQVLLDVCSIPFPYGGNQIFLTLMQVLKVYNLEKRILSCTHDNSQSAIHACHALKEELDAWKVPFSYLSCAAQTLNCMIEDGLRSPRSILTKIREFTFELNSSVEVAQDFIQMASAYQESSLKFPVDTSSRWSGCYAMLDMVQKASNSMDMVIRKHGETFRNKNILLTPGEKTVVSTLHAYLEPFYKVTTDLCTCKVPTVGLVLFFMDHIFEKLGTYRETCPYDWLKAAADDMTKRIRNFSSQVYNPFAFITSVLDPRIKKEFIPESLNTEKNLDEARSHFIRHYMNSQFPAVSSSCNTQDNEEMRGLSFAEEIARQKRRASTRATTDELAQYLSEPPAPFSTDTLEWWKANSTRYPRLSIMARDYLATYPQASQSNSGSRHDFRPNPFPPPPGLPPPRRGRPWRRRGAAALQVSDQVGAPVQPVHAGDPAPGQVRRLPVQQAGLGPVLPVPGGPRR